MKKSYLVVVSLVVMMLVLGIAFQASAAKGCFDQGKGGKKQHLKMMAQKLKLTPDQEKEILKIKQKFERATLSLRHQMQTKKLALKTLWQEKELNRSAIEKTTKELVRVKIKLTEKRREMREQMKKVLTPEQLEIFEKMPHQGKHGKKGKSFRHCGSKCMAH